MMHVYDEINHHICEIIELKRVALWRTGQFGGVFQQMVVSHARAE